MSKCSFANILYFVKPALLDYEYVIGTHKTHFLTYSESFG